jgi:DNA-binding Xre family transcriptional regulator
MKSYETNETFKKIFYKENCTQIEMGHRIELDKHSVHDWLKNKNEMKFSSLENVCKKLNINIKIIIEYEGNN